MNLLLTAILVSSLKDRSAAVCLIGAFLDVMKMNTSIVLKSFRKFLIVPFVCFHTSRSDFSFKLD